MRTRVKICGITSLDDALVAIASGADALGFVFYPPSPRYISPESAAVICQQLPPFITKVALFVNEDTQAVESITSKVSIDLIQFHGDESAEYCQQFCLPYIKAVRVESAASVRFALSEYQTSSALLLDTYKKGVPGGTGETFDWQLVPGDAHKPIILAGGLNGHNVAEAIATNSVYAVDVSGGVEQSPGIKSASKIHDFIAAVIQADRLKEHKA